MEPRKVTIINSKTQSQSVITESTATTLGELKREMDSASISYDGMTFFEGHMRAELKDDASPLPETIPYKGQEVRDLVFMLTTPEKKIKSGSSYSGSIPPRKELYTRIKTRGLEELCKTRFGKNFTQCSSKDLMSLVMDDTPSCDHEECPEVPDVSFNLRLESFKDALVSLVDCLFENDLITPSDRCDILSNLLGGEKDSKGPKTHDDGISQEDIDNMFDFINN